MITSIKSIVTSDLFYTYKHTLAFPLCKKPPSTPVKMPLALNSGINWYLAVFWIKRPYFNPFLSIVRNYVFSFIKKTLSKIYASITSPFSKLFGLSTIDKNALAELEIILLAADTGVKTTRTILSRLEQVYNHHELANGAELKKQLSHILKDILQKPAPYNPNSNLFMLVGINGSGKTTFAAKLAHLKTQEGNKVLLVAADTFRAAATEQLALWAEKTKVAMYQGGQDQDPAAVVFQGCQEYKDNRYDTLIIDTAGRLQTKTNLMQELAKIKRVMSKQFPEQKVTILLTIDSMLGQNSFEQAKLFQECTQVDGVVLTKMDGTAKGGIVFSLADQLNLPIAYITFGETVADIKRFDNTHYVEDLLSMNE